MFRFSPVFVLLPVCVGCQTDPYTVPIEGSWRASEIRCDDEAYDGRYDYTVHPPYEGTESHTTTLLPFWALERDCTHIGAMAPFEVYVLDQTFTTVCDRSDYTLQVQLAFDDHPLTADATMDILENDEPVATCEGVFYNQTYDPNPFR